MSLLLLVQLLAVCCLVLAGLGGWLFFRQKSQQKQYTEFAAKYEQLVLKLTRRLDVGEEINIRIGEELRELRSIVMPLSERIGQLEQRDPGSLSFSQAAHLMNLGVSVEDLSQTCGLTRAEAELMSRLHEKRSSS
ncbi:DUF2802 domain-containing protein [Azomonas macrocytogenes]|uniref:DUF2802 domain-containing protein n=1 Tax=Azomonas macrocytogenes TaxID=69962 RepID=A0A839SWP6_AZOMA|nr:DUF2802 domain-containing protein [Azomonas macrocytogenes]MBB3101811.1 hypothetical protein [Azomonas macrocytogenes]